MRTRYLLTPPGESRPSLLVDLVDDLGPSAITSAKISMVEIGCANGIVLDANRGIILRDTFTSTEPESVEPAGRELRTEDLLPPPGELAERLERWLHALSTNWQAVLASKPWAKDLLMDIVPAAAGSIVHRLAAA